MHVKQCSPLLSLSLTTDYCPQEVKETLGFWPTFNRCEQTCAGGHFSSGSSLLYLNLQKPLSAIARAPDLQIKGNSVSGCLPPVTITAIKGGGEEYYGMIYFIRGPNAYIICLIM